ncbi:MAG: hypothetical protein ACQEWI_21515 [Bacillota bacterium]
MIQKLFVAGTNLYEVWVDELEQKLNLPIELEASTEDIWFYAEEKSIQTFQKEE